MNDYRDLKLVLMLLGNRLVTEQHFSPAPFPGPRSTKPIDDFVRWLNDCPEARELLKEFGYDWPMVR